ncbi:MAG TPA: transglutaminaseTgpA domain-containing protein, partial [Gemmataceae bacterium]|nr:transglutaminaseTgpA domain-containing protein [Gemmataceae bacterium]
MMPTNSFRLSTYLTLAASCACLGYAEAPLSPVAGVVAGVVVVLIVALFFAEERLPLLSIPAANRVGLVIALASVVWMLFQTSQPPGLSLIERIAPTKLLPAVGPILLVLMPAKLLRREKHVGDYWTLHGCALAAVSLAAAMGEDAATFGIAAGYALLAVWSLSLFFLARSSGAVPPVPGTEPEGGKVEFFAGHAGRSDLSRGLLLAVAAAAVAFPLFFVTPRSGAARLDFGQNRIEVGYAADQMTDLNRTGDLRNNPEVAFEVYATELDGRPKTDLNPEQLWRGSALANYTGGTWGRGEGRLPTARNAMPLPTGNWSPPSVGPDRFLLAFRVPAKLRATPLASPLLWLPGGAPPVASLSQHGTVLPWRSGGDGTFFDPLAHPPLQTIRYTQVTAAPPEPGLGTGYELTNERGMDFGMRPLVTNPVPKIKDFADELRNRLIAEGKLPAAAKPDPAQPGRAEVRLLPPEEHHEAIARAFTTYLAESPEFTYTTNLRRDNKKMDPVEEFLTATKSGHCERFASALVLMLRSQGIPAVFVLGFKGGENLDGGNYAVRQEHAHAWVEVFIPRHVKGGPRLWHWLTLDPTPSGGGDANQAAAGGWWNRNLTRLRSAFQNYVLNYTPEQRQAATRAAVAWLTRPDTLIGLAGVVVALVAVRKYRRRPRAVAEDRPEVAAWFGQLMKLLAARGYSPGPGETPLEFATTVADALRRRPAASAVADVPLEWVEAYYLARFGG